MWLVVTDMLAELLIDPIGPSLLLIHSGSLEMLQSDQVVSMAMKCVCACARVHVCVLTMTY